MMRVGIGYDIHPLEPGRPLLLGGLRIEHEAGLRGHSDGDVLCHAIIDALLGAAGLGDIGRHYPADDQRLEGANSLELLRRTAALIVGKGSRILNIDSTVIAEVPRLAPYADQMREHMAGALGLETSAVSVKSKTADALGPLGHSEGIAALAVALIDST